MRKFRSCISSIPPRSFALYFAICETTKLLYCKIPKGIIDLFQHSLLVATVLCSNYTSSVANYWYTHTHWVGEGPTTAQFRAVRVAAGPPTRHTDPDKFGSVGPIHLYT
jgi:hypothetical protein